LRKRIKLWQLRGVEECVLESLSESYYNDLIKPHLIKQTNSLLRQHQQQGDEVWIISGGYGIYLKHFVSEYGIDRLLSSNLKFKKGVCVGSMKGLDCMRENKVKYLKKELGMCDNVEIIASYSDSYSDLPILSVAERKYVVSRSHQLWVDENKYVEILWN
jgi:HAD superfamily phosphoserine phosphatase-like hydrolase